MFIEKDIKRYEYLTLEKVTFLISSTENHLNEASMRTLNEIINKESWRNIVALETLEKRTIS